ncbi:MAG TPA: META domain-containing protein, partial [Segetibacter sp.]
TTTNVNGVAYTSTEVEVRRVAPVDKQITPAQGTKMHMPEKPSISFFGVNETFSGFTGCNKYTGRYKINGNKISLNNPAASTKMVCLGNYDEKTFLNTLASVNSFRSQNGQLELLNGEEVLLVFTKK